MNSSFNGHLRLETICTSEQALQWIAGSGLIGLEGDRHVLNNLQFRANMYCRRSFETTRPPELLAFHLAAEAWTRDFIDECAPKKKRTDNY